MKIVYQTDAQGLFVGQTQADESPLEPGVFLTPGGCVDTAPPEAGPRQIAKWVGDSWLVIPDFRGFKYWTADRQQVEIQEVGQEPPQGYLSEDPGPTSDQIAQALKQEAQVLLDKSDQTVGRCFENQVPVPEAWKLYRSQLRAVVSTGSGPLPVRPAYPAGT